MKHNFFPSFALLILGSSVSVFGSSSVTAAPLSDYLAGSYTDGAVSQVSQFFSTQGVPEPASFFLGGCGLILLVLVRLHRKLDGCDEGDIPGTAAIGYYNRRGSARTSELSRHRSWDRSLRPRVTKGYR